MLKAMKDAGAAQAKRRSKEFNLDVEYFFVESSIDHFPILKSNLEQSEFRSMLAHNIHLLNDVFTNRVEQIVQHIRNQSRKRRAIFLLDQFGYKDVPLPAIRSILSQLEHAEIILTFAADSLIDYLSELDSMQMTLERMGLQLSKEEIRTAKEQADWRCAIQILLHDRIFLNSGARHYTPFFIRSADAHRDYWLIHLSNHSRARDVMVGLHWDENTSFAHYAGAGLSMLGYDPDRDTKITGQPFLFDQDAREHTMESLLNDLPGRIRETKDGVEFGDFFARVTNETPATSDLLKSVLTILRKEGIIEIRAFDGLTRRSGIQNRTDIIKPSSQPSLFVF